jgi:phosphoribosylaminoimidazole-succinocarboxamide synthase
VIDGKGRIAAKTTARVFRLLNLCGLPTHYLSGGEDDDNNEMLVRRAQMLPLEVVVRGVAAGSFVRRRPGVARGAILIPRVIEFFLKDDANHDPLIEADAIVAQGIATPQELGTIGELARITYEVLAHAWRRRDTLLVDLKIEFGRIASGEGKGQLVIADVIDNDSWRVWPQGREELMLDKQRYRNLTTVTPADLAEVRASYETVAETVGTFPLMRPGMVAIVADGPEFSEPAAQIARALATFGLPTARHVASATRTPGYVLQLVTQLDATFARLIFVTVGSGDGALAGMIDYASATPVIRAPAAANPELIALQCAKAFALEDTIVFGRVLLIEANARSHVLQADAALNVPPPQTGRLA